MKPPAGMTVSEQLAWHYERVEEARGDVANHKVALRSAEEFLAREEDALRVLLSGGQSTPTAEEDPGFRSRRGAFFAAVTDGLPEGAVTFSAEVAEDVEEARS